MTLGQQIQAKYKTSAYGQDAYSKQKQIYEALGSPMGAYKGSYDQNIYLLNNINKWDAPAPVQQVQTPVDLGTQYAQYGVDQAPPANTPQMEDLNTYWDVMAPTARASAMEVVDPWLMRSFNADKRSLISSLAQTGAGDFGRGWGQLGQLQADTMNSREAQVQDFTDQYKSGFEKLWYDPTLDAWTKSLTTKGANPVDTTAPGWDQFVANNASNLPKYTSGLNGSAGANPYQAYMPNYNQTPTQMTPIQGPGIYQTL